MVQYNAEYDRLLRDAEIIARNLIATNAQLVQSCKRQLYQVDLLLRTEEFETGAY